MSLAKKVKLILKSTNGETLIEGLASILVFVVLIASVTMMIMVSLRITARETLAAEARQREAGAVLSGNPAHLVPGGPFNVAFTVDGDNFPAVHTISPITVRIFSASGFAAFEP
ncbi:MAG: hypothetical protein FWD38_08760 [Oscillospiraceae bacterium]|nr:hypothetical protein [Oscillospiraceae bacterium]